MKSGFISVALAVLSTLALASAASAQPISEPASCAGYLASWANPNNGFIMQELVLPAAREQGTTPGSIIVESAQLHLGGLEPCIP